jgi:hypothetical protein
MTLGGLQERPSSKRRPAWLFPILVLAALAVGLLLGALSLPLSRLAVESGQSWLAVALDVAIDTIGPLATAVMAVAILRTAQPRKLWLSAAFLLPPLIGSHYSRAYHPLIMTVAEAAWLLLVLSCISVKRTFGICCGVVCATCTLGIHFHATALKHSGPALHPVLHAPLSHRIEQRGSVMGR